MPISQSHFWQQSTFSKVILKPIIALEIRILSTSSILSSHKCVQILNSSIKNHAFYSRFEFLPLSKKWLWNLHIPLFLIQTDLLKKWNIDSNAELFKLHTSSKQCYILDLSEFSLRNTKKKSDYTSHKEDLRKFQKSVPITLNFDQRWVSKNFTDFNSTIFKNVP